MANTVAWRSCIPYRCQSSTMKLLNTVISQSVFIPLSKLCRSRTARTSVLIAAFHLLQSRCCKKTGSESPDVSIYPWELEESHVVVIADLSQIPCSFAHSNSGSWTDWSPWGLCSVSCGGGIVGKPSGQPATCCLQRPQ